MKTLQNDLTTIEQSKRLLELGVPKNSANHYCGKDGKFHYIDGTIPYSLLWETGCTPCWSVGRMIEIYLTCALEYHPYDDFYTETPSLHLMAFDKNRLIEEVIDIMSEDKMDFSKLEG